MLIFAVSTLAVAARLRIGANVCQHLLLATGPTAVMRLFTLAAAMMCLILVFLLTAAISFGRMIQGLAPLTGLGQGDELGFRRRISSCGLQTAA